MLGPNPQRYAIYLFPSPGNNYSVGFGEVAAQNAGVTVIQNGHPVKLTYDDLGEQIHASISVISGSPGVAGWLEVNGECPCQE